MRLIRFLDEHFEETLVVILLIGMTAVVGFQVFMRYVMQSSLTWSEELSRYMFIWMVDIGISYGVRTHRHISVDALATFLSRKNAAYLSIIADVLFLFFSVTVIFYGVEVVRRIMLMGQSSPALEVQMHYIYSALPVGFGLVALRLVQSLTQKLTLVSQKKYDQIQ